MPETGGYQSAYELCSVAQQLYGVENVAKVFLTIPKRNFRRVLLFLKLAKGKDVYIAEGYVYSDTGNRKVAFNYYIFKYLNYFGILKFKKLLRQSDIVIITGYLKITLVNRIRSHTKSCRFFFNHAGDPSTYNSLINSTHENVIWTDYLKYMCQFSRIVFQSDLQSNFAKSIGLPENKCFTLRPTCGEDAIIDQIIKSGTPFESGFFNVITVGTIQERKNQELVIEIASTMMDLPVRFYLIGDDTVSSEYTEKLKRAIRERSLENVFILGHRHDYILFVYHCNAILNFSKYEGVSRVLRESLFLGKIIIATRIRGNTECVSDGENGFLCDFNVAELSEKILRVRNLNSNEIIQFEQCSKLIYKKKYSFEGYKRQLSVLFSFN